MVACQVAQHPPWEAWYPEYPQPILQKKKKIQQELYFILSFLEVTHGHGTQVHRRVLSRKGVSLPLKPTPFQRQPTIPEVLQVHIRT